MGRKPKRVAEGDGKKGKKDVFCLFDTFGHLKCRFNSKKYLKIVKIWLLHSVDYV